MSRSDLVGCPPGAETIFGELAQRLQKPVPHRSVFFDFSDGKRLRDEILEDIDHVQTIGEALITGHGNRGIDAEGPREHRQPLEENSLLLGEKLIRPINGRRHRAVALLAPSRPTQHTRCLVESLLDLGQR